MSAVVATFFWWVGAPIRNTPAAGEIPPYSISANLNHAIETAQEWEYFGHVGRDSRCRALPVLGARARQEAAVISIRFIIIDPSRAELCTAYADYRSRSRSSALQLRAWNAETVQIDLLATIICLIRAKAQYPQLRILLGLSMHFSMWRFDRSDQIVIVTQEEPQQPAYKYIRGSRFFAYYRQECEEAWLQSAQFTIEPRKRGNLDDADVVKELQNMLGDKTSSLEPFFKRALAMARENTYYA